MAILTAPAPTGGDDQTILQNFLNSIGPGDYASFAQGSTYRHSGRLLWKAAASNVTLMAEGVVWRATNSTAATFYFNGATNVEIVGLWHRTDVQPTTRNNNANDVGLFAFNSSSGIKLNRIRATGSAGLSVYYWNTTGGEIKNSIVENSLADGWHFTNGSGGFTVTDCQALNTGDDGFAHVGYSVDGTNGRPQNITLIRPVVRDCRARSISYSGARDCTANDVDLDGSLAASIYFATERGDFNTLDCARCTVNGGRIVGAGRSYAAINNGTDGAGKDQGFILWLASGSGATVVDCVVNDVSTGNAGPANYDTFRAIQYGGTFSGCSANRTQLYAGSPSTYIGGNIPSAISPATSTDRRGTTIPASTANVGTLPTGSPGGTPATIVGSSSIGTPTVSGTRGDVEAIPGTLTVMKADSLSAVANGASVTSWVDKKGRWTLVPGATAPTKVAAGALNNKPAVRFNGTTQNLKMDNAPALAQPFTIGIVIAPTTVTGDKQLIWQGSGGESAIYQSRYFMYSGAGGTINTPVPTTGGKVLTYEHNGSNSSVNINGALGSPATVNPGTAGMTAGQLFVMDHGTVDRYFGGDLYEIRVWNHQLTDAEEASWHSYVQDEYGVTVADYQAAPVSSVSAAPATKSSGATIGQPAATPGPVRVYPRPAFSTDPDGAVVGQASATPGGVTSSPSTVTSTASAGQPAAAPGPVTAAPAAATSAATIGQPTTLVGAVAASPATITATSSLGTPTASSGAVGASPATIPSSSALGAPAALAGPVTAVPASVPSGAVLGQPATSTGEVSATPSSAAPSSTAGQPTAALSTAPVWRGIWFDDFNRAAASGVPTGYRIAGTGTASWSTNGTQLVHTSGGTVTSYLLPTDVSFTSDDQYVRAVQGSGANNSIFLRYTNSTSLYGFRRTSSSAQMYRIIGGTSTTMGPVMACVGGDSIAMRAQETPDGTVVTPYVNDVAGASVLLTGTQRIYGRGFGVRVVASGSSTHIFDDLSAMQLDAAPVADQSATPAPALSTLSIGAPAGAPGDVTVAPLTATSTASTGSISAAPGSISASPTTAPSTSSTGVVTAAGGSVTATPATRVSTVAIGSITASPGDVTVAVPALGSTSSTGAVTATGGAAGVLPATVPSGSVLGQPAAVAGPVTAAPTTVPSTSSTGTPTATVGQLALSPGTITAGSTFGVVTTSSSISRSPTPRTAASTFGAVVVVTSVTATPGSVSPGASLGPILVRSDAVVLTPSSRASGATLGTITAGAGPLVVIVSSIEPTSTVGTIESHRIGGAQDIDVIVGRPRVAAYILEPRTRAVSASPRTAWRAGAPTI